MHLEFGWKSCVLLPISYSKVFLSDFFCQKRKKVMSRNDDENFGKDFETSPWGERVGFVSTRLVKNEGYPQKMSSYFKGISPESDCKCDIS